MEPFKISLSFEVIPRLQEFVCFQIHVFELVTSLLFLFVFVFVSWFWVLLNKQSPIEQ